MNNSKLKYLILIVTLALILIPNKVEAKKKKYIEECLGGLSLDWDENGTSINPVDAENSITLTAKETNEKAKWEISFDIYDEDTIADLFEGQNKPLLPTVHTFEDLDSKHPFSRTVNLDEASASRIAVFVKLKEKFSVKVSDKKTIVCHPGEFKLDGANNVILFDKKDSTITPTGKYETYKVTKYDADLGTNINSGKVACNQMQKGLYSNKLDKTTKGKDIPEASIPDYQDKMAKYFPYCFPNYILEKGIENPNFEISNKTINSIRQNFIHYYNEIGTVVESSPEQITAYKDLRATLQSTIGAPLPVSGNSNKNYVTDAKKLICDETQEGEKTVEKWAEKEILNNDYCKVSCIEKFETIYDPPRTIKAGMCFSYKVTVKSKVNCITEKKDNADIWPKKRIKGCKFKALCEDESDQAGPNEEFDSCIQKCDRGKYSQSCINKCYKKVYENNNKKTKSKSNISKKLVLNTNNKGKISFLGNGKDSYKTYVYGDDDDNEKFDLEKNCSSWSKLSDETTLNKCAEGFKEAKDEDPLGKYEYNETTKRWTWNPTFGDSSVSKTDETENFSKSSERNEAKGANSIVNSMKRAAPYYLRSIESTKILLKSFFGEGKKYGKIYNIDNFGIKRQTTFDCKEECWFKKAGADGCLSTDKEVAKQYDEELAAKQAQITACVNATKDSCSTTEANFEIGANGEMKQGRNKSGNKPEEVNNTGINEGEYQIFTKLPTDKEEGSTGINGKCYGIELDYEHHYKTTITLPKSNLDYKTGKKVDNCTDNTCIQKDMYCTRYDDIPVNEGSWYRRLIRKDQYQYVVGDKCITKNTEIYLNEGVKDYNINANVTTFGKFNWHVSVDCFYALYNSASEYNYSTPKNSCITVLNRVIRAVDPKDPFNTSDTQKTRVPGFNWTSAATNKDNDSNVQQNGYGVDPEKYLQEFTTKAKNNTLYSDSELDFEANIGPKEISELKKLNKHIGQFNYGDCDLNINNCYKRIGKSDLYYYRSKLLTDFGNNSMDGNPNLKIISKRPEPGYNNK